MFQPLHNCCDGCRDFEDVWISPVDDGHGERVSGEEKHDIFTRGFFEFGQRFLDVLSHCLEFAKREERVRNLDFWINSHERKRGKGVLRSLVGELFKFKYKL